MFPFPKPFFCTKEHPWKPGIVAYNCYHPDATLVFRSGNFSDGLLEIYSCPNCGNEIRVENLGPPPVHPMRMLVEPNTEKVQLLSGDTISRRKHG